MKHAAALPLGRCGAGGRGCRDDVKYPHQFFS